LDSSSSVLAFADAHLKESMYRHRADIRGDALFSVRQIISLASSLGVPAAISAGDLFDSAHPEAAVVRDFHDVSRNVPFRLLEILGNHDRTREAVSWTRVSPGAERVESLSGRVVELGRLKIAGLNACPPDEVRAWLAALPPDVNLVVLHLHLAEALPFGVPDLSVEELPAGQRPRLYLLGDIHSRFDWASKDGRIQAIYPGSTWPTRVDETGPRYCAQIICRDDDSIDVAWHQLQSRPVLRTTIASELDFEKLIQVSLPALRSLSESLPAEIRAPIVEIRFTPDAQLRSNLEKSLQGWCHTFLRPMLSKGQSQAPDETVQRLDVRDAFRLAMGASVDDELLEMACELYQSRDPAATLSKWESDRGIVERGPQTAEVRL